jgi:exosome complex RNA-binding protein Csl4
MQVKVTNEKKVTKIAISREIITKTDTMVLNGEIEGITTDGVIITDPTITTETTIKDTGNLGMNGIDIIIGTVIDIKMENIIAKVVP